MYSIVSNANEIAANSNCASAAGARDIHQGMIAPARAEQRHGGLDQRQRERQHQRVMSGFRDHFEAPCAGAAEAAAPGLAP